jgi:hypothetical protein
MAGVVLIAASSGLPDLVQTAAAGVRDLAFAGMGASLVLSRHRPNVMPPVVLTDVGAAETRRAS